MEKSSLEQRNAIPKLIDAAIEAGDVSEIVKLRRRSEILDQYIIAERMAEIKSEIKSKQQKQIDNESTLLKELIPQMQAAAIDLDEALKVAQEKNLIYDTLSFKAGICDNTKITLHEDVVALNRELKDLKIQLRTGRKK